MGGQTKWRVVGPATNPSSGGVQLGEWVPGVGARVAPLGLCAGAGLLVLMGLSVPSGREPNLGGEGLLLGELVQQLLAWQNRARAARGTPVVEEPPVSPALPYLPGSCSRCLCITSTT